MIDPVQSFWYKVYDELKLALLIEIQSHGLEISCVQDILLKRSFASSTQAGKSFTGSQMTTAMETSPKCSSYSRGCAQNPVLRSSQRNRLLDSTFAMQLNPPFTVCGKVKMKFLFLHEFCFQSSLSCKPSSPRVFKQRHKFNCSCNQYIDSFSIDKIGFDFDFKKN